MDLYLGGQFLNLGRIVFDYFELRAALNTVFPLVVSCSMQVFGPSGSHIKTSSICALPINILNEKAYLLMWFWFLLLTVVSLLQLLRQAALLVPSFRLALSPGLSSDLVSPRQVEIQITFTFTDFQTLDFLARIVGLLTNSYNSVCR